jgi:hypothetical protein
MGLGIRREIPAEEKRIPLLVISEGGKGMLGKPQEVEWLGFVWRMYI